ncbi:MAG TPA: phosphotransferase [Acidimicrobiales bacterium]|nr:phosphotransferase [Acidimicrobiales bacterium]
MTGPGPLIASGRDAEIFAYGPGLVLRRSRDGRSIAAEAKVMEYVRGHGYPVPAIDHLSDDGTDLVMERIEGLSMGDVLVRKPWTLKANGALLGELHRRLHEIPAPEGLAGGPGPAGSALVHLDLHPLNVLIGPHGPVVIDWSNARKGAGPSDVALAWVLMMAGEIPVGRLKAALLGRGRRMLVDAFTGCFDLGPVRATLRAIVEWKVTDPHMSEAEQERMWDVVRREERRGTV